MLRRHFITAGAAAVALLGVAVSGADAPRAADYPSKTIKTIVPFGAGGGTDRWARVMSSVAFDVFGEGMHVQNRGGASGTVGWKNMLDQGADGHTILLASPTPIIAALQESDPPFDPNEVKVVAYYSVMKPTIVAPKDKPFSTWEGLVKYAKEGGDKLTIGGTITQLLGALSLFSQAGVEVTAVPYSGTGKAVNDFLGGHIDLAVVTTSTAIGLAEDQAVIANASNRRYPGKGGEVLKDVPNAEDLGFKPFNPPRFVAMHPDTSDEQAKVMSEKFGELLQTDSVKQLIGKLGEDIVYVPYEEAQAQYNETVENARNMMSLLN